MAQAVLPNVDELVDSSFFDETDVAHLRLIAAVITQCLRDALRSDALGAEARASVAAGHLDPLLGLLVGDEQSYQAARRRLRDLAGVGLEMEGLPTPPPTSR